MSVETASRVGDEMLRAEAASRVRAHTARSLWLLFGSLSLGTVILLWWVVGIWRVGRGQLAPPDPYTLNLLVGIALTWLVFKAAVTSSRWRAEPTDVFLESALHAQSRVWRFLSAVVVSYVLLFFGIMLWYVWIMKAFGPPN
jgi:hypothetical protein